MKAKIFTRTDSKITRATIGYFWEEIKRDRKSVIYFSFMIPFGHLLYTVLMPLFLSLIIQSLITHPHDLSTPLWLLAGIIILSVATMVFHPGGFTKLFNHEERVVSRLSKKAMDRLLTHSYEFFSNRKVGSLAGDVNGFVKSYQTVMDVIFLQSSPIIINFVASLLIIGILSPILLLPLGLLTVLVILLSLRSLAKRAPLRNERKKAMSELNGIVADILGNQILVRVFAREPEEISTTASTRKRIEDIARKEIKVVEHESVLRYGVLYVFQALTILIFIWLFTHDQVSIAALIFAVTYLGRVTGALFGITAIIRTLEQGFLDAAAVTEILSHDSDVRNAPHAKELRVQHGAIKLDRVNFQYAGKQGDAVFNDLSLDISPGERIGLAGHSGGGKTTLTKILLRFADIQGGAILIDGQDISQVTQSSLRSHIAYVPQEPFLFHRSLRENIAYGKPDATDKQIRSAAKKAHALEFIDKLPQGLDTTVGERGVKLSGGQRQRIAIARAILKDAPILILDEATSALDSESEKLIQSSLSELMKGRTAIVIAHRLSTIQKLDRIIVMDDGNITEQGTHGELLKSRGTYAKLWAHQSGGFIED
jgi:ATP-binding cassette subfamily B protein